MIEEARAAQNCGTNHLWWQLWRTAYPRDFDCIVVLHAGNAL